MSVIYTPPEYVSLNHPVVPVVRTHELHIKELVDNTYDVLLYPNVTPPAVILPEKLPVVAPEIAPLTFPSPLKLCPQIVRVVNNFVAEDALPVKLAVITPAEKFPDASRTTTLPPVFAEVPSTAQVTAAFPF